MFHRSNKTPPYRALILTRRTKDYVIILAKQLYYVKEGFIYFRERFMKLWLAESTGLCHVRRHCRTINIEVIEEPIYWTASLVLFCDEKSVPNQRCNYKAPDLAETITVSLISSRPENLDSPAGRKTKKIRIARCATRWNAWEQWRNQGSACSRVLARGALHSSI